MLSGGYLRSKHGIVRQQDKIACTRVRVPERPHQNRQVEYGIDCAQHDPIAVQSYTTSSTANIKQCPDYNSTTVVLGQAVLLLLQYMMRACHGRERTCHFKSCTVSYLAPAAERCGAPEKQPATGTPLGGPFCCGLPKIATWSNHGPNSREYESKFEHPPSGRDAGHQDIAQRALPLFVGFGSCRSSRARQQQ